MRRRGVFTCSIPAVLADTAKTPRVIAIASNTPALDLVAAMARMNVNVIALVISKAGITRRRRPADDMHRYAARGMALARNEA